MRRWQCRSKGRSPERQARAANAMAEVESRSSLPWPLREPSEARGKAGRERRRAGERPIPAWNGGRRGLGWSRGNVRGCRAFQ